MNGLLVELPGTARALGELAVLARRGDGPRLDQADGLCRLPALGPPPRFTSYSDYAEIVGQLEKTGCIPDYTHIWWDIRPHPRLGTVEIRVCDGVTRVEHAVALAAYCQALVKLYCERFDSGEEIRSYHRILTSENKWLAARYGLEAPLMDLETGHRNRVPVAQLVRRRLEGACAACARARVGSELEGIQDSSRTETAPPVSSGSSTRTGTSSRSCARSPRQPRLRGSVSGR